MRHRNKAVILDRQRGPRILLLRNLAASVIIYEKVKTTGAKAKAVKPLVEKMISLAKRGDLTARRQLIEFLPQPLAVKKAMDVLGPRYAERSGGYCRIVKLVSRQGDGADMAQVELV